MGRRVVCDDSLLDTLRSLEPPRAGLLVGEVSTAEDRIVLVLPSPPLPQDQSQLDDAAVSAHTRNVMRMAPGGMSLLGVVLVSSGDASAGFAKLRTLALHSYSSMAQRHSLLSLHPDPHRLLLLYTPSTKTYTCKRIDASNLNASLDAVDLKVAGRGGEEEIRIPVESGLDLRCLGPLRVPRARTLRQTLREAVKLIKDEVEGCIGYLEGRLIDKSRGEEAVSSLLEGAVERTPLHLRLFTSQAVEDEGWLRVEERKDDQVEVCLKGDIVSRVYVLPSTSLQHLVLAVKEDVVRSCYSKLEMLWETADEHQSNKLQGLNEVWLGRRVSITVPGCDVGLTELVLPDEVPEDILSSVQDTLCLPSLDISQIQPLEPPPNLCKESKKGQERSVGKTGKSKGTNLYIVSALCLAILTLLLSIYLRST